MRELTIEKVVQNCKETVSVGTYTQSSITIKNRMVWDKALKQIFL
ncbi:hypothetical protein LEP1GSC060_3170 [Leptospira weilii serovar Ranarum str. ICFT]|uniref:Uncharacterized protein n=1 Tax=Leptospira weilii serovar Ranarum str. ICFT TaxID=1218598 RepID=N1WD46_9LEPT|nr:hypothetical protein LEP1GSC060_3170 [Leptospira weilii serovar Ranarum str. ICFT]